MFDKGGNAHHRNSLDSEMNNKAHRKLKPASKSQVPASREITKVALLADNNGKMAAANAAGAHNVENSSSLDDLELIVQDS